MDGSTISGFWSLTSAETLDWQMFASDVPVSGDAIQLDYIPPPEAWGEQIAIKVEVTDPMDRSFTAHLDTLATILPPVSDTGGCEDTGSSFIGNPGCSSSGDPSSDSATGDSPTGDSASSDGASSSPDGTSGASSGPSSDTSGPDEQPGGGGADSSSRLNPHPA